MGSTHCSTSMFSLRETLFSFWGNKFQFSLETNTLLPLKRLAGLTEKEIKAYRNRAELSAPWLRAVLNPKERYFGRQEDALFLIV